MISIKNKIIILVMFLVAVSILITGFYLGNSQLKDYSKGGLKDTTGAAVKKPLNYENFKKDFLMIGVITFIVVLVLTSVVAYTLIEPVDKLIIGTQLVAKGELDNKIEKRSNDEIGRLVDAFNVMVDYLKEAREQGIKYSTIATKEKTKAEFIIDSMGEGIIVTDSNHKIILFNKAAENIFDVDAEKVIGKHILHLKRYGIHNLYYNPENIEGAGKDKIEKDKKKITATKEFNITKPCNKVIKTTISPVIGQKSRFGGSVSILTDITALREMDNMKTEFVSTVSHELRTPLTSIKGYTALMLDGKMGETNYQQNKTLKIIKNEADRLEELINDILDLSKMESGKMKLSLSEVAVEECIECINERMISERADGKGINVKINIPKNLPKITADKSKITQLFTNLIDNAIKFTNQGGEIKIHARDDGEFITVDIIDNGIGISREELQRIFDKFYQIENHLSRKEGGTGLGLAIVKQIIELHKGKIDVKSRQGKGTAVTFSLPKRARQ